jgi:hypothetical protein
MIEADYIKVQTLTRLRAAYDILSGIVPDIMPEDSVIPGVDLRTILSMLDAQIDGLRKAIGELQVTDDG